MKSQIKSHQESSLNLRQRQYLQCAPEKIRLKPTLSSRQCQWKTQHPVKPKLIALGRSHIYKRSCTHIRTKFLRRAAKSGNRSWGFPLFFSSGKRLDGLEALIYIYSASERASGACIESPATAHKKKRERERINGLNATALKVERYACWCMCMCVCVRRRLCDYECGLTHWATRTCVRKRGQKRLPLQLCQARARVRERERERKIILCNYILERLARVCVCATKAAKNGLVELLKIQILRASVVVEKKLSCGRRRSSQNSECH